MTIDETWIYHYELESKQRSKQWVGPGGTAPKRAKTQQSAGKVIASVFWDSGGILFVDYLEKEKTINMAYYCTLLDRFKEEVTRKNPYLLEKMELFARQCTSLQIDEDDGKNQ